MAHRSPQCLALGDGRPAKSEQANDTGRLLTGPISATSHHLLVPLVTAQYDILIKHDFLNSRGLSIEVNIFSY